LLHANLVVAVIDRAGQAIEAYIDDVVRVISRLVVDP
jgi:hypothetical protein